jgi:hypothetical protein
MKALRMLLTGASVFVLTSCPSTAEKPVGPVSEKDPKPWNPPVAGQGAGAFGAMPQQPRR